MRRHLDLLNVFLALRFKQPGYPSCLFSGNYLIQSIGVISILSCGAKIAPDVIASRVDPDITFLVEVKGGRDFDDDQFSRMLKTSSSDLRDLVYLPIRDVATHVVHLLYFCNNECAGDFVNRVGTRASVVGFDGERFSIYGASLPDTQLADCLSSSKVLSGASPLGIVPFDGDSPDEEVARAVIPHVIEALIQGTGTVTDDLIVSKTHQVKSAMSSTGSGSEQSDIIKRTRRVLDDLATGEFSEWIERSRNQQPPIWRFLKALSVDGRTRELQKLQRAAYQYLERKGAKQGLQLSFEQFN